MTARSRLLQQAALEGMAPTLEGVADLVAADSVVAADCKEATLVKYDALRDQIELFMLGI